MSEDNKNIKIVDFDSALKLKETNFNGPRGTVGYMAEGVKWLPGSQLWDLWAFSSSLLESFIGVELYNEVDSAK